MKKRAWLGVVAALLVVAKVYATDVPAGIAPGEMEILFNSWEIQLVHKIPHTDLSMTLAKGNGTQTLLTLVVNGDKVHVGDIVHLDHMLSEPSDSVSFPPMNRVDFYTVTDDK